MRTHSTPDNESRPDPSEVHHLQVLSTWRLDPRFQVPTVRDDAVGRAHLTGKLLSSSEPVITVVAPPGYGKTTLLAQFAERLTPRVAWISCAKTDNHPISLWAAVTTALGGITPVDSAAAQLLASCGGRVVIVPELLSAIAALLGPLTLVLDRLEVITNTECRSSIADFADRIPEEWRLVLASRDQLPLPTARLRAEGRVLEIGMDELAMTCSEASELLNGVGAGITDTTADELVRRTEGWPTGLYLAAMATKARTAGEKSIFTGDHRWMADYLHTELLSRIPRWYARFLTHTSVLDSMCGPLCDAVVGSKGSGRILEELVERNLLVRPLDSRGEWYRYHHLLRDLLTAEVNRNEPDLVPELHARAAAWYEDNDMPEAAIEHAQAAGDEERVVRLVMRLVQPVWASGRVHVVRRWMEWLGNRPSIPHAAAIAAHGALIFAMLGRASDAERWAAVAERLPAQGTLPDGSSLAATLAYLRASLCRAGITAMREDARAALDGLSPTSPYRTTMLHAEGLSYLLENDWERADAIFAHAADAATSDGNLPLAALILAERSLVAAEVADWIAADQLIRHALTFLGTGVIESYWTSALVYAAAARNAVHQGDAKTGRLLVERAARLRPLLTYALPAVSVQALVEMARVYIALADPMAAKAVLQQTRDILQQRPRLGALAAAADQLKSHLRQMTLVSAVGVSSLTAAELRLLPLLPTYLSFEEIGERLNITRNTVKTQALSIYRKLGVSSRSEAVNRTSGLGLHPL